jgi:hypothetical protein
MLMGQKAAYLFGLLSYCCWWMSANKKLSLKTSMDNNYSTWWRLFEASGARFYYYHWFDASAVGWLIVPEIIIFPVVSLLDIFITEIYSS